MPHRANLADRIDLLLPQTQCRRCGYPGCRPYADAIAEDAAPINRCAPGGQETIARLAALLDVPAPALDAAFGVVEPLTCARIDEAACIGCTLCIRACPVDAIVGAKQRMHTVLLDHCTGCGLCLPPCPVDCIVMMEAGREWTSADAATARIRFDARNARLARVARRSSRPAAGKSATVRDATPAQRRETVAAALARARARRR